jgi:type I restriction enzyme R subunit
MIASPLTCLYNIVIILKDPGNKIVGEISPMTEADTCRTYVVPKLYNAGWDDDAIVEQMVLTPGRIVPVGNQHTRKVGLRPDYVLFIRRNIPIAVVEAKAEYKHPVEGLQQAMQYAEMLGVKFAYSSNGKGIIEHDFITGEGTPP